jgi:hypothetical protein
MANGKLPVAGVDALCASLREAAIEATRRTCCGCR